MSPGKQILGRAFAVWAILIFLPTMLIALLLILATGLWKEPTSTRLFQHIARVWMRIFFFFTGIRITVTGKQHFKKGEAYIICCNHNSLMDIPLTTPFIPGPNKTIAKKEMASIPLFGIIYKTGSVLVDRKSEESRKNSFIKMKQVLQLGLHMCIYPEGTRNKTGKPLQPFHNGAFKLSLETGRPILPAVIFNSAKVLPPGHPFFFWPAHIRMEFLEPIPPVNDSLDVLKGKVFNAMQTHYVSQQ
jgi:1-acyl-sn-glycerol-3-phosphate acyltransferase